MIRLNMEDGVVMLARALREASGLHGRPNTFSPGELETFHRGPPVMLAGRIGKSQRLMHELWKELGLSEGWGSCPRYENRRFAV